jgi:hypothetical protein
MEVPAQEDHWEQDLERKLSRESRSAKFFGFIGGIFSSISSQLPGIAAIGVGVFFLYQAVTAGGVKYSEEITQQAMDLYKQGDTLLLQLEAATPDTPGQKPPPSASYDANRVAYDQLQAGFDTII